MTPALALKPPQRVYVAPGAVLDDRTAARTVERMLVALEYDQKRRETLLTKVVHENCDGLGNPKGQQRFFNRYVSTAGNGLLYPDASFGKRKRFIFNLDQWIVERGGLLGCSTRIAGVGPGRPFLFESHARAYLTNHALVRLVQRLGCLSAEHLVSALALIWDQLLITLTASDGGDLLPEHGEKGWIMPLPVNAHELAGVVMVKGTHGEDLAPLVIPTILAPSMIHRPEALEPMMRLMADYFVNAGVDWDAATPQFRDALRLTATATNRRTLS